MLPPSQLARPHHKFRQSGRARGGTNLEHTFGNAHDDGRAYYWKNGVAEAALQHPKRGPELIDAFLKGVNERHGPLTGEERQTWKRLWAGCPHRSSGNAARAFGALISRDPAAALALLDEGLDLHLTTRVNKSFQAGDEGTGWTMMVERVVTEMEYARTAEADGGHGAAWALIEAHAAKASTAERQAALGQLARLSRSACVAPGAPAYRMRETLFELGGDSWASAATPSILERTMAVAGSSNRDDGDDAQAQQAWSLGFFRTPAPKSMAVSLNQACAWPDPLKALTHLAALGVSPWNTSFVPQDRTFVPQEQLRRRGERWREALIAMAAAHPPSEEWLKKENKAWVQYAFSHLSQALRNARHDSAPHPATALPEPAIEAWRRLLGQAVRLNRWGDEGGTAMPADPFKEGAYDFLNKNPLCGDVVRESLVATGTLGSFLIAASTDAPSPWQESFWRAVVFQEQHQPWVEAARTTPQWPVLRRRLWAEAIACEVRSHSYTNHNHPDETALERLASLSGGCPDEDSGTLLWRAAGYATHRTVAWLATPQGIEEANANPSFWDDWAKALLSGLRSKPHESPREQDCVLQELQKAGVRTQQPGPAVVGALLRAYRAENTSAGRKGPETDAALKKALACAFERGVAVTPEDFPTPPEEPLPADIRSLMEQVMMLQTLPQEPSRRARARL